MMQWMKVITMMLMLLPCKSIVVSTIGIPSMDSHTYYHDDYDDGIGAGGYPHDDGVKTTTLLMMEFF